ncbi:MAG: hypothetical protein M1835_008206 [Candelina submexicana]|nr:MAG: hypothetical protein M1835_008206 [Candelina submexicana]
MAQLPLTSLLLLPPLTWPPSFASVDAVYGRPVSSVLSQVAKLPNGSSEAARLQIAVPCAHLCPRGFSPRHQIYDEMQKLVAALYSLITVICTRNAIDIDDQGGVNFMVLLLAYDGTYKCTEDQHASLESEQQGPIVNLKTLAACCRPWTHIFSLATKEGEKILEDFVSLRQPISSQQQTHPIFVKINDVNETPLTSNTERKGLRPEQRSREHAAVAVGGTFDHLHAGHKLLLTMTALMVEPFQSEAETLDRCITVGITGDELLKSKNFKEYLESWEDRQTHVTEFLTTLLDFSDSSKEQLKVERISEPGANGKAVHTALKPRLTIKCVELSDPFGPTITDKTISALIISAETRSGAKAINSKRQEKGWQPLEVYEVDVLDAGGALHCQSSTFTNLHDSFASKISSTAIRQQISEKAHASR